MGLHAVHDLELLNEVRLRAAAVGRGSGYLDQRIRGRLV
jgi:hypothetical protein